MNPQNSFQFLKVCFFDIWWSQTFFLIMALVFIYVCMCAPKRIVIIYNVGTWSSEISICVFLNSSIPYFFGETLSYCEGGFLICLIWLASELQWPAPFLLPSILIVPTMLWLMWVLDAEPGFWSSCSKQLIAEIFSCSPHTSLKLPLRHFGTWKSIFLTWALQTTLEYLLLNTKTKDTETTVSLVLLHPSLENDSEKAVLMWWRRKYATVADDFVSDWHLKTFCSPLILKESHGLWFHFCC